ncbi:MAG: hypothetical protein ACRDJC_16850 [Thermomicrobiales bacterium]
MRSYVELFDLRSANVVANYADENEAWAALRQAAMEFGLEEIEGLGLSQVQDGHETLIAMEDELVRRVAHELNLEAVASESRR